MDGKNAQDAAREAQRDLATHPDRPLKHEDAIQRYVAGFAYTQSQSHQAEPGARQPGPVDEPPPVAAFTGKYVSVTSFKQDGTGVPTPVWFVQESGRLLVQTTADSYKVRRIRRNPSVTVAVCTATGRLRGQPVTAQVELLADSELDRVERLIADKYRIDLVLIRPIRALQALRHRGKPQPKLVIMAITPT